MLGVYGNWLSTAEKTKQSIPLPTMIETKQSIYHLSLFVQQVEACLILFLPDNILTANSNRLLFVY